MSSYDWDPEKAEANQRKHGEAHEEDATVTENQRAHWEKEREHGDREQRAQQRGTETATPRSSS